MEKRSGRKNQQDFVEWYKKKAEYPVIGWINYHMCCGAIEPVPRLQQGKHLSVWCMEQRQ